MRAIALVGEARTQGMTDARSSLRRSARRLRIATIVVACLISAAILIAIAAVLTGRQDDIPGMQIRDDGFHLWTVVLSLAVIGGCLVLALLRLTAMLTRVEAGNSVGIARDLRSFASWLFLSILGILILPALIQLAIRLITGTRVPITITISLPEAMMLLTSGLLFFVARLVDEAERVAADASQII